MKFHLVSVLFISLFLIASAEEAVDNEVGLLRNGVNGMMNIMKNRVLPVVGEKTSKFMEMVDYHSKPIQEKLHDMKEKMSERLRDVGLDILEASLDLAEKLQNITSKIKSDIIKLVPRNAERKK